MKKRINKKAVFIFTWFSILCVLFYPSFSFAQKKVHSVYFEGTDYELHIYRIYGKEPGKTLILIGGIQGDEPGGFLSADHYADISLVRGNLIVVPRANFQSIVLNRRKINEDMNRKFADDPPDNYEKKVVEILKKHLADRILFGTDIPWANQKSEVNGIKELDITADFKNKIFCNNARELLDIL